jgi:bifunctional oligoribonuclease and PAP phosphatase NrnA
LGGKIQNMNYPESQQILEEIKKANKILINCHRSPDPDSVASAISIQLALKILGKDNTLIVCPDDIPENCKFLIGAELIKKENFDNFDFDAFDTFIIADSGNWNQVSGKEKILASKIKKIVIDHHFTNPRYGDLNLLDEKAGSCCGVLFNLFNDWDIAIHPDLATSLLTGIIADTMSFQTDVIGVSAFKNADTLIGLGADRRKIVFNLYMSRSIDEVHLMGEMLSGVQIDIENKFAWVAIPKDIVQKFPKSQNAKSYIAGVFIQSIEGTDFGYVLEEYEGYCSVSLRSRADFDVSKIAEELGGGGHKSAAAFRLTNIGFEDAIKKVLDVARKYAKKV